MNFFFFLIIAGATPNYRGCNQSNLSEHKHQFYLYRKQIRDQIILITNSYTFLTLKLIISFEIRL